MLVVMTFNVGLLISATMGLGIGSLLFNTLVELPQMPQNVILTEKRGDYEPNPDPCCSKAEMTIIVSKKDKTQEN
jgi:hypothetical protein